MENTGELSLEEQISNIKKELLELPQKKQWYHFIFNSNLENKKLELEGKLKELQEKKNIEDAKIFVAEKLEEEIKEVITESIKNIVFNSNIVQNEVSNKNNEIPLKNEYDIPKISKSTKNKIEYLNTIIDNMLNLELLFWASKNGGSKHLYDMAYRHAQVTAENQFRKDYSTCHVVVYDTISGKRLAQVTHQGYADTSMWARGQAWAIYGFTMCYRETGNGNFLKVAQNAADIYLRRLPSDGVPYWDFDAPNIPNEPKDASAAAVVASGLLELSSYLSDKEEKVKYFNAAVKMLRTLSSSYQSRTVNDAFLLHSTGHKPNGSEIDASIIYADYYYLEALMRLKRVYNNQKVIE